MTMPTSHADFAQAQDIDGVLERMSAIDAALPAGDGVAYFNRMYREVTRLVADAVRDNEFLAAEFLTRLDVNFANLFFTAYADAGAERPVSPRGHRSSRRGAGLTPTRSSSRWRA